MQILFDEKLIENLVTQFNIVSKVQTSVFDYNGQAILNSEKCCFCGDFSCSSEVFSLCGASNTAAFEMVKREQKLYIYRCHAGLMEMVSPIIHEKTIIGYLMIGQFLSKDSYDEQWKTTEAYISSLEINPQPLKESFYQLTQLATEEVVAWAEILSAYASYIWLKEYVSIKFDEEFDKISQYISANLADDLISDQIAKDLKISRNSLFRIIKHNSGQTLSNFITEKRILAAKKMLKETNQSINAIAEAVGIEDYNYFTKVFKKIIGKTPSQYRKSSN
ncbi:MAG: PocR ligand-binding domain-containing protein [Clostridia bacterium]